MSTVQVNKTYTMASHVTPTLERGCKATRQEIPRLSRSKSEEEAHAAQTWAKAALDCLLYSLSARSKQVFKLSDKEKNSFVDRYAKRLGEGTAVSFLKFHTSYIFAFGSAQLACDLPVPPSKDGHDLDLEGERAGRPFGGGPGRYLAGIMARARHGNWSARRVCYDMLMSKLGMPVVPSSFVAETLKTHCKGLTRSPSGLDSDAKGSQALVREKIDELVRKTFGGSLEEAPGGAAGRLFRHRDLIPSLRACFENGLSNGGGLGFLFESYLQDTDPEWFEVVSDDEAYRGAALNPRGRLIVSSLLSPPELVGMTETGLGIYQRLHEELVQDFQHFVDLEWWSRSTEKIEAKPLPILEPLKVRIITKGGAPEYYRALELQKFVHGTLRQHPIFRYIGCPASNEDFLSCFGTVEDLKPDEFYVSGDYKAATDNLDPGLSEYAWERICFHSQIDFRGRRTRLLNTPYYDLGRRALTGHHLNYKFGSFDQSWGQLMGSPVSFPVLCLVNAAATMVALDMPVTEDARLRVNGDDIAFIADSCSYGAWKYITKACGLEFSLGKNYTSREFMIVNSELRRPPKKEDRTTSIVEVWSEADILTQCDELGFTHPACRTVLDPHVVRKEISVQAPWQLEGFVNQSILRGLIKKGMDAGKPSDVYWPDLSRLQAEALRGLKGKDRDRINQSFIKFYHPQIKEAPGMCHRFTALSLGGMGLERPTNWVKSGGLPEKVIRFEGRSGEDQTYLVSKSPLRLKQRKLAAFLSCNTNRRLSRPAPGRRLVGPFSQIFSAARAASDPNVPPVVRKRPSVRVHGTELRGGACFLGELLAQTWLEDVRIPLGGETGDNSVSSHVHGLTVAKLNRDYLRWIRGFEECSLTPMKSSKARAYVDDKILYSYIELLETRPSSRQFDN